METTFLHGNPLTVDYTPGSAVDAGDVIVLGATVPFIAHLSIAANKLGALAAGGGVYKVTAGGTVAAGEELFWNATAGKVNVAADATTGDTHFGFVSPDSGGDADDTVIAIHAPNGSLAA